MLKPRPQTTLILTEDAKLSGYDIVLRLEHEAFKSEYVPELAQRPTQSHTNKDGS